jgi:hypothetical protein
MKHLTLAAALIALSGAASAQVTPRTTCGEFPTVNQELLVNIMSMSMGAAGNARAHAKAEALLPTLASSCGASPSVPLLDVMSAVLTRAGY